MEFNISLNLELKPIQWQTLSRKKVIQHGINSISREY